MAEAPQSDAQGGPKGKKRAKKQSTKIDMTPMVDLAFLLLTFFILTTTLAEQKVFDITMPVPDEKNENPTEVNNAATLVLTDDDKIIYYFGEFKGPETQMFKTDFKEMRKILADKNKPALERMAAYEKKFYAKDNYKQYLRAFDGDKKKVDSVFKVRKDSLWRGDPKNKVETGVFAIIKYDDKATYRNVVDMIDEMDILGISSYAIVEDLSVPEKQIIELTFPK